MTDQATPGPRKRTVAPPKPSERTTRDWREVGNAIMQVVYNQTTPVTEGYAKIPEPALGALFLAIEALNEYDRHLAKIDGAKGGVGGEFRLVWEGASDA